MFFRIVRFSVFLILASALLYSIPVSGQQKDVGLWTSVNFEAKVVKKLTATLSEEVRFNENITEVGTVLTDVGLDYKLNKRFQFSLNYRFSQKRAVEDYYILRHRIYADVKYEKKLKPIQIQFRTRIHNQDVDAGHASNVKGPEYYLRNKLSLKWDMDKPYQPYISVEAFSPLNYPRYSAFDAVRTTAGVDYDFSKHHKIDAYYMIQKEVNVSNPTTLFVIGIGYFYKL